MDQLLQALPSSRSPSPTLRMSDAALLLRRLKAWRRDWLADNAAAIAEADTAHAAMAEGPAPRRAGKIGAGLHRVVPDFEGFSREQMHEFWTWLYLERPYRGQWTRLQKCAGHRSEVYVFGLWEDALLMQLRWGCLDR